MKKNHLLMIAIIYSGLYIALLIIIALPFYQGDDPISQLPGILTNQLIFGGFPALILILISIKKLLDLHLFRAIIYGIIGCIAFGINLFLIFIDYFQWSFELSSNFYIGFSLWFGFCGLNSCMIILYIFRRRFSNDIMIRKTILDLGRKYARLEVREISEKCEVNRGNVIDVIKEMINNQEIHAEYFSSSKTVAFDKQTNIKEIDRLMEIYKKREEDKLGKK